MAYFYAVKSGRRPGVYNSWPECKEEVLGIRGAIHKKFRTREKAEEFMNEGCATNPTTNHHQPLSNEAKSDVMKPIEQELAEKKPDRITPIFSKPQQVKRRLENTEFSDTKRNRYDLPTNAYTKKRKMVVYTDGACSGNGQTGARAGYGVFWGDNDSRNISERLKGNQTNQRAEATAVIHALKQSQSDSELLEVRTDSQYIIKAITDWSVAWKKNGWMSSKNKPVENRDVFENILDLISSRKGPVEFVYVPGHSGEEGNEKADQLAVAGAQK